MDFDKLDEVLGPEMRQPTLSERIKSSPEWSSDEHAESIRLSRELGTDPRVVKDNLAAAKVESQFVRVPDHKFAKDAPNLTKIVDEDPDAAIIVKDDLEPLLDVEREAASWGEVLAGGAAAFLTAGKQIVGESVSYLGGDDPRDDPILEKLRRNRIAELKEEGKSTEKFEDQWYQNVDPLGEMMRDTGLSMVHQAESDLQAISERVKLGEMTDFDWKRAAFGALSSGLPTVLSAAVGMTIGRRQYVKKGLKQAVASGTAAGLAVMGASVYPQVYREGKEQMGLSEEAAKTRAILHTAAELAPEGIVLGRALRPIKGALGNVLGRIFETGVANAIQEGLTSILQNGIDIGIWDKDMTLKEVLIEMGQAAQSGVLMGPLYSAPASIRQIHTNVRNKSLQRDLQRATQAENSAAALQTLAERIKKSKTFGRDKHIVARLIANSAGTNNVYLDSAGVAEMQERLGQIEGERMMENLGLNDQLDDVVRTGGDFVLRMDKLVEAMEGETFNELVDIMRMTPGGATVKEAAEAREYQQGILDQAEDLVQGQTLEEQILTEADAIQAEVKNELLQAGHDEERAEYESSLYKAFSLVYANKNNITPRQAVGRVEVENAEYDPETDALPEEGGAVNRFDQEGVDFTPPEEAVEEITEGTAPVTDETAPEVTAEEQAEKDGRAFRDFFSSVVTGAAGRSNTGVPYRPVIAREDLGDFAAEYQAHRGNFDDHIAFSIPGYKEVQMAVGSAISKTVGPEAVMLDIGASEGSIGKTISQLGGPQTVSMDPNPDMAAAFESHSQVPGATYAMAAFSEKALEGKELWTEGDIPVLGYKPETQFDVIHEAMTFQFINNNRREHVERIKEMLAPGGLVVMEEKFHNKNWDANERKKNEYKSQYFEARDMSEKATAVLEGMNQNMVQDKEFEQILNENFEYVAQFWDAGNFKGYAASNDPAMLQDFLDNVGDLRTDFSTVETPRTPALRLGQSASLRRGKESPAQWGLQPGIKYKNREVAIAMTYRQGKLYGKIDKGDHSPEALSKIAKFMATEVRFELEHPEESGLGWYAEKWQQAIDEMGYLYPELLPGRDQQARNMFTLIMAFTSDGAKIKDNFKAARTIYEGFRENKRVATIKGLGGERAASYAKSVKTLNALIEKYGTGQELHDFLLQEMTVKQLRDAFRHDKKFSVAYEGKVTMPASVGYFGPKLGAFYANLMGSHGYLTMDRWWSRTFNRYRGDLIAKPTQASIDRFRALLIEAGVDASTDMMTDNEIIQATIPYRNSYKDKGYDSSIATEMEVAGNGIYKKAFEELRDTPDNASDRTFMLMATKRAQKNLKRSGVDLSIADIQAVLWYYEKRLYGELGAKKSADISYLEAARQAVRDKYQQQGISIEVAPDPRDSDMTAAFRDLSPLAKVEATHDVAEAVVRDIAAKLGFPEVSIKMTNGGYLDEVNPSLVISAPGVKFEDLRPLAVVLGETFSQKAILAYDETRTEPRGRGKKRIFPKLHVRLKADRDLNEQEQEELYRHLLKTVPDLDGFTWREGTMVLMDTKGKGDEFTEDIFEALKTAPLDERIGVMTKTFYAELMEMDHGDTVQAGTSQGNDILRTQSGDSSASVEQYRRQASDILSDHLKTTYGQEADLNPVKRDPSMAVDLKGELPLDSDGLVPLTHWGRVQGTESVDPLKQGTGAAGAEKRRVDRPPRSYWGLPGYRVESGPLSLADGRVFARVEPSSLYDLSADPDGLYASVRDARPGLVGEGLFTAVEHAIKDRGYQGYWGQHGAGGVAALFHAIPFNEVLPNATRHKDGTWVAGYDAAGNGKKDQYGQAAFHGTGLVQPFPRFSTDFVGGKGGEGAQVVGWGLYFAGRKEVAEFYRKQNAEDAEGRLYHVDLDVDEAQMLDWDAPMSKQHPIIQDLAVQLGFTEDNLDARNNITDSGRSFYRFLSKRMGSDRNASLFLDAAGVHGNRFLDADSRDQVGRWVVEESAMLGPDAISADLFNALGELDAHNATVEKANEVKTPADVRQFMVEQLGLDQTLIEEFNHQMSIGGIGHSDRYNYVIFDDTRIKIETYEQTLRGDITFDGMVSRIRLFETANKSTFLHETGHFFLERLRVMSRQYPEAKKDLDVIMKWFGVTSSRDITRKHHEMFARGFESYLMEGKAPSRGLRTAFSNFRKWLMGVYETFDQLKVQLTDEVRQVMDGMLQTDMAYAQAEEDMAAGPPFANAEEASMTEAEFTDYMSRVAENRNISKAEIDKQTIGREMKLMTHEFKQAVEQERVRLMEELAGERLSRVRTFLINGEGVEGVTPFKLDLTEITEKYPELVQKLPKGSQSIAAQDGMPLDEAAVLLGYESGDQLIKEQADYNGLRRDALKQAREIVAQEKGYTPGDENHEAVARDAIAHKSRTEQLFIELKVLDRATGGKGIPREVLKAYVKRKVLAMTERELTPGRYLATSIRKAKEAAAAIAKKDNERAAKAKREQITNHLLYIETRNMKARLNAVKRFTKKLKRKGVRAKIDKVYLDQIDNLLEAYDFSQVSVKEAGKRADLHEFVKQKLAAGEDVLVPEAAITRAAKKVARDRPVSEILELQDWLKNLEHLGKLKGNLIASKNAREFKATKEKIVVALHQNHDIKPLEPDRRHKLLKQSNMVYDEFAASLDGPEQFFMELDGDTRGAIWEEFWLPISEAQDQLALRKMEASIKIRDLMKAHNVKRGHLSRKVRIDSIDDSLELEERMVIALNWGNAGGRQRLMSGPLGKNGTKWNESQIQDIINTLSVEEANLVEELWAFLDSYWSDIHDLEVEMSGVPPKKVDALPVQTPHGNLTGGYWPLVYDKEIDLRAFQYDAKKSVQEILGGFGVRTQTAHGHTEARLDEYDGALLLSLDVLHNHVSQVLLDLTHRKPIIAVHKLANDREIAEAMMSAKTTRKYQNVNKWLQYVANSYRVQPTGKFMNRIARRTRIGAGVLGLGLRVSTGLLNLTGAFPALVEVRNPITFLRGFQRAMAHPLDSWRDVRDVSPFMATRSKAYDREVAEQLRGPNKRYAVAYSLIVGVDRGITLGVWLAAHDQHMKRNPGDEKGAIQYADSVVRTTQGSGRESDLSDWQRAGNEAAKMTSVFYSYFNTIYNKDKAAWRKLTKGHPIQFANDILALNILPAVVGAFMLSKFDPDDDPEDWLLLAAKESALYSLGTIPLLRDFVNAWLGGYDYQFSPAVRAFESIYDTGNLIWDSVDRGKIDEEKLLYAALDIAGYWGHIPTGQLKKTTKYIIDNHSDLDFNAWYAIVGEPKRD